MSMLSLQLRMGASPVPLQAAACIVLLHGVLVSTSVGKNEPDVVSPSVLVRITQLRTLVKSKAFISLSCPTPQAQHTCAPTP